MSDQQTVQLFRERLAASKRKRAQAEMKLLSWANDMLPVAKALASKDWREAGKFLRPEVAARWSLEEIVRALADREQADEDAWESTKLLRDAGAPVD